MQDALEQKQELDQATFDDKNEQVTDPPSESEGGPIEVKKDVGKEGAN